MQINPWWRGAVIYQVYPRSLMDSNADGIGDIPGIIAKLDYIASLGVDAVWISPFFKSPMKDFGYDISDYRDIDPIFGTLNDFDRLVEKAHAMGIKIIIDQVLSHTSDQHAWFEESRQSRDNSKADWYGRPTGRRHSPQQLAVHFWRLRLGVGAAPGAVLPAQLPEKPARPELPQPRRSVASSGGGGVLVKARR